MEEGGDQEEEEEDRQNGGGSRREEAGGRRRGQGVWTGIFPLGLRVIVVAKHLHRAPIIYRTSMRTLGPSSAE